MYTVLIIMLALGFVMVSCGTNPPQPQPQPTPQPQQPTPQPIPQSGDVILDGAQTHTVVAGDTLSNLSLRYYSDDLYFPLIMLGSPGIVKDPDEIEPGMRLTIPNLRRNLDDAGAKARIKSYLVEIAAIYDRRDRPHYANELRRLANSL